MDDRRRTDAERELPVGWVWTTLGKLLADKRISLDPSKTPEQTYELYSVPSHPTGQPEIVSGKSVGSTKQVVSDGDVLICKINPRINRVWIVGRDSAYPKIASTEWLVFPKVDGIHPSYLCYFLRTDSIRDHLAANVSGVGGSLMRARPAALENYSFPLAPLPEQRRVVAKIEELFTRLDSGVRALKRVQAALKRYKASVLKAACEGRLMPQDASDEPADKLLARILAERRAKWEADQRAKGKDPKKTKYEEPRSPKRDGLPELPEGWVWGVWGQISEWITYGFTRPMPHVEAGVPIVTAKNISGGQIDFEDTDKTTKSAFAQLSDKDRPELGDILITKDGALGRAAVVETKVAFCINQSVAVMWLRSCPLERSYLRTVIESPFTQKRILDKARGVAIQHLSITDFAKMPFPIPPLAEQRRIVVEVERQLSVVAELEKTLADNLARAGRLRQAILHRAFTGRLVPQDPNDEPAERLLERIRAGRGEAASPKAPRRRKAQGAA